MEDESQISGPPTAEKGKELTPFIVARRVRTLFGNFSPKLSFTFSSNAEVLASNNPAIVLKQARNFTSFAVY